MGDVIVIGCGGGGSWLVPALVRVHDPSKVILVDGDTLEEKNLDRQLFDKELLGMNKAEALSAKYKIDLFEANYFHSEYFTDLEPDDFLFCCADNHACRREVLTACDQYHCRAIIAGNEYTDTEAYFYEDNWKGTPNDPRVFYPAILTDHTNNPLAPEGCTGAIAVAKPQLVLSNILAVQFQLQLHYFHTKVRPELEDEDKPFWPVLHRSSKWRVNTVRFGDRLPKEEAA